MDDKTTILILVKIFSAEQIETSRLNDDDEKKLPLLLYYVLGCRGKFSSTRPFVDIFSLYITQNDTFVTDEIDSKSRIFFFPSSSLSRNDEAKTKKKCPTNVLDTGKKKLKFC